MIPTFRHLAIGLASAIFLFGSSPSLRADEPEKAPNDDQIAWVRSLDRALQLAREQQIPVFVAIHSEVASRLAGDSEINRRTAQEVYRDPAVLRTTRRFVCLAASPDVHGASLSETGVVCPHFGRVACPEHQAVAEQLRTRFFDGAELTGTEHLVLSTEGRLFSRDQYVYTPGELVFFLEQSATRLREEIADRIVRDFRSPRTETQEAAFLRALRFLEREDARTSPVQRAAVRHLDRLKRDDDRRRAWKVIVEVGNEASLALLLPTLSARSPHLRQEVLEVFAQAEPFPTFLETLAARILKERSEPVLLALVKVFDRYADQWTDAYAALNRLVRQPGEAVRVAATLAAARPDNRSLYPELLRRARAESNPRVRVAAILGLARMHAVEALPALESIRRTSGRNSTIRAALDLALASLAGAPEAVRALDDEVDRLKAEAGLDGGSDNEPRDRTDRKWRGGSGRS